MEIKHKVKILSIKLLVEGFIVITLILIASLYLIIGSPLSAIFILLLAVIDILFWILAEIRR